MGRILNVVVFAIGAMMVTDCNNLAANQAKSDGIEQKSGTRADDRTLKPGETSVALDRLPAAVKLGVTARMKDFEIIRAKREVHRNGRVIYAVLGRAKGRLYEMEVSPEGKVLEVEEEDDDEEDDVTTATARTARTTSGR